MSEQPMTSGQRNEYVKLCKQFVRAMKADGELRAAKIVEAFETEISELYGASDDRWAEAVEMANDAVKALNAQIGEHFAAMGLNPAYAPGIDIAWRGRSWQASDKERRAELRAQALAQAEVVKKKALASGERLALEVERTLLVDQLSVSQAQELIRSLPPIEELMPPLNVERIEAIARAADRQGNSRFYRLWSDNEPLLTGKPLPQVTSGKGPTDIGDLPYSVYSTGRYVQNLNGSEVEDAEEVEADALDD
jgi:hypothetical protein